MAQKTVKVTVCDRCGHQEDTIWPAKVFVSPGGKTKKSGRTWELCDGCKDALEGFLLEPSVDHTDGMD